MPKSRHQKQKKPAAAPRLIDLTALESALSLLARPNAGHDDLDRAQQVMYDAWEAPDRRRRLALAKKALTISPLCADAFVLLGQERANSVAEAIDRYRRGVAAGEKALGQQAFSEDVGMF